jgi:hypothetical protein
MGQNLVGVHLDASQWARVDVLLEELEQVFEPEVIRLAPEHRQRLMKMGEASEPFCRKAFTAMRDHPAIVSRAVDLDELARDFASHDALAERRMRFDRLLAKLEDTDVALGSDIMTASLKGYALLKLIGDGLGLDGLRRDLGRRFDRKRRMRGEGAFTAA